MKPHYNMTADEIKAYMEYRKNNELTPEEKKAYREWVIEGEDKYGCDASVIPIEALKEKSEDEIWEMILQKRAERRKRNEERARRNGASV